GHLGRSLTKRRLRQFYWWPGMDREVERMVSECVACGNSDKTRVLRQPPLGCVQFPTQPWEKLALDFIGPVDKLGRRNRFLVVLVDYHSKWFVVKSLERITTSNVIEFLKKVFLEEGVPRVLITDNGVQLVSASMKEFLTGLGIKHEKVALFHPQANGLVERVNRMIMENIQLSLANGLDWRMELNRMLWAH
ncbi:hypothetical protein NDU88_003686, partial [Pleurodeles waltl]